VKRRDSDLLIPQGLFEELRRGTGEGLVILKGLVTGFPPSLKRLFADEPFFEGLFLVQNRARFRHFLTETCR